LDARFFTVLRTFVTPQLEFLTPTLTDHWTKKQGYTRTWCPHFRPLLTARPPWNVVTLMITATSTSTT
jgi:hypothetical protein